VTLDVFPELEPHAILINTGLSRFQLFTRFSAHLTIQFTQSFRLSSIGSIWFMISFTLFMISIISSSIQFFARLKFENLSSFVISGQNHFGGINASASS